MHVPENQRKKLDDRNTKCVLLGVSEESKAYKLFDLVSQKILISRDVVFDETAKWDWNKKEPESKLVDLSERGEENDSEGGEDFRVEESTTAAAANSTPPETPNLQPAGSAGQQPAGSSDQPSNDLQPGERSI